MSSIGIFSSLMSSLVDWDQSPVGAGAWVGPLLPVLSGDADTGLR